MNATQSTEATPAWFCWLGNHRAEFLTLGEALAWNELHKNKGLVTDDPLVSVDESGRWAYPDGEE